MPESGEIVTFTANDVDRLLKLHELVFDAAEAVGCRLVVELWDQADQRPVAWVEVHPSDSEAHTTFSRPDHSYRPARPTDDGDPR